MTTNNSGNAIVPQWRLGKSDIPQTLRATAGNLTATTPGFVSTDYSVDLRFFGPAMPPAASAAFTAAAARIRGAVTGDVVDISAGAGQDLTIARTGNSHLGILRVVSTHRASSRSGKCPRGARPCYPVSGDRQH